MYLLLGIAIALPAIPGCFFCLASLILPPMDELDDLETWKEG
jgi:hypothetical protein